MYRGIENLLLSWKSLSFKKRKKHLFILIRSEVVGVHSGYLFFYQHLLTNESFVPLFKNICNTLLISFFSSRWRCSVGIQHFAMLLISKWFKSRFDTRMCTSITGKETLFRNWTNVAMIMSYHWTIWNFDHFKPNEFLCEIKHGINFWTLKNKKI